MNKQYLILLNLCACLFAFRAGHATDTPPPAPNTNTDGFYSRLVSYTSSWRPDPSNQGLFEKVAWIGMSCITITASICAWYYRKCYHKSDEQLLKSDEQLLKKQRQLQTAKTKRLLMLGTLNEVKRQLESSSNKAKTAYTQLGKAETERNAAMAQCDEIRQEKEKLNEQLRSLKRAQGLFSSPTRASSSSSSLSTPHDSKLSMLINHPSRSQADSCTSSEQDFEDQHISVEPIRTECAGPVNSGIFRNAYGTVMSSAFTSTTASSSASSHPVVSVARAS